IFICGLLSLIMNFYIIKEEICKVKNIIGSIKSECTWLPLHDCYQYIVEFTNNQCNKTLYGLISNYTKINETEPCYYRKSDPCNAEFTKVHYQILNYYAVSGTPIAFIFICYAIYHCNFKCGRKKRTMFWTDTDTIMRY